MTATLPQPEDAVAAQGSESRHDMPSQVDDTRARHDDYASCTSTVPNTDKEDNSENGSSSSDSEAERTSPKKDNPGNVPRFGFSLDNAFSRTKGRLSKADGRLKLSVNETANKGFLAKALGTGIKGHLGATSHSGDDDQEEHHQTISGAEQVKQHGGLSVPDARDVPRMNIVIMVIGSRGDIQPFIKVGNILKENYHHRVRIATHPAFKDFVEKECGLEFFSVGGDPSELMAYMVKNPGLLPSIQTLKEGEIGKRRAAMSEMFRGFWRACVDPSDAGAFEADAIISNPPVMCHSHCAERLGCPLHIMFTFPYTPTQSFPHPLANIKRSNVDVSYTNFMSYPLVEMFTWQGLGDLVNDFRMDTLGLDPVSTLWAPGQLYRLHVPFTYMWSPGLVPKPVDWGPEVDVTGFVFLGAASDYEPPQGLTQFLEAGEQPVYIGFGSIVVDDPDQFTRLIYQAVKKAGVRACVNKGWGGIGGKDSDVPENIFMLDSVPHDWLFPRLRAVVHHGGAGTTAIGLKCGKPTMIVPFFGDQPFWGSRVAEARAGAHQCIPYKELTADKFAEGIRQCLTEEAKANAAKMADSIAKEGDGAANAVDSFHARLPLSGTNPMRCSVFPDRVAVWKLKNSNLRLSALAAELLVSNSRLDYNRLRLWRTYEYNDFQGSGGPVTGVGSAMFKAATGVGKGAADAPLAVAKDVADRTTFEKRKYDRDRRREKRRRNLENSGGPTETTAIAKDLPNFTAEDRLKIDKDSEQKPTKDRDGEDPSQQSTGTDESDANNATTSPVNRTRTGASSIDASNPHKSGQAMLHDTGHAAMEPVSAIAKFPMDLFLGVANGFHNLPRLYGDDTVRRPVRISGLRSGLKAAGTEFTLQSWDAATGVFTQPVRGYQKDGTLGFATGIGKGIGGFVLKGCAAVTGPIAFTMKGIHKEATKSKTPLAHMRTVRISQGEDELSNLSESDRQAAQEAAQEGWQTMNKLWQEAEKLKRGEISRDGRPVSPPVWIGGSWLGGLKGRFQYAKERKHWEKSGAFENLDKTKTVAGERIN